MARNDGVDRTSVRNLAVSDKAVGNTQQHNEREKDSYRNPDIIPQRAAWNVHFKKPTASYTDLFAQLGTAGTISTRGLKPDATHYCELVFDVNSAYFDNHGGYEFAKQFYEDAYKAAVQIVGGEQYILSAVMHADEINRAMTEALGREVYHYHLHVVYVPVVEKQILWSKRCKDKALVGTVKETVMQVSRSKKWASKPLLDDAGKPVLQKNGKPVLKKSYSVLQDDFFNYMRTAGYTDVERGERGSTEEHLTVTQFKVQREQERLDSLTAQADQKAQSLAKTSQTLSKKEKELAAVQKKATLTKEALIHARDLDYIGKRTFLGNYSLTEEEFSKLKKQADHGYMMDVENRRLKEELSTAKKEAAHWGQKYHELWYEVKPYLDALHRAPELVRGFLEKILAPKQERTIWTVEEMRAALDSMEDPILHLAVHLTLVGALREGEIVGLTPEDLDFDAADGIGTFRINKSMQRVRKEALNQVDDGCIIKVFPDKLERSTTSLILKSTKTASSCRTIFMTSALKEELKKWLNQLAADEMKDPTRYHDIGMLFRLPNGLAIEPVLIRKKFLKWQDAHPEFPRIVFHGLRHSSATYQLMISGGDVKAVQGTTGHATADMLVNTYAHIQQSSRVELGKKFEEGFYAKSESPSPQAVPAAGEPTISMTALLELLKNADPEVKAQLRLALLT